MNQIITTIDSFIYIFCLFLIIHKIFKGEIKRKGCVVGNILLVLALLVCALLMKETEFLIIWSILQLTQLFLVYFSFFNIRLSRIVSIYAFLYSINSIIIVAINSFIPVELTTIAIIELFVNVIISFLCLFCCFYKKVQYRIRQIIFSIPTRIKIITLLSSCISAGLMVILISNSEMYEVSAWSITIRISLIFFSLFVCSTFPILIITVLTNTYLKKQNESFERELEAQASHYIALAESNKELRRFKHDFKNLRIGITKALTSGDSEIALEMIENGQNDFISSTDSIIKFNTGNGIVDAILSEKQKKAGESNTNIMFEGMIPQNAFSPTDLCVIFGNTLDNAIEACEKIPHGEDKTISISVNFSSGFVFISISNPVAEKVIVHDNHIETTKKDRAAHGFGLYSLGKIAKKYNGEMKIISEEHTFTLTLDLCV